ncbi:MAG: hypothetical protein HC854_16910, partial [Flavobacterium sp.]|nr:hypothetical protein [Flavobacterium sp.]
KRLLIPAFLLILLLSGCFEVVQETTVKANGSGVFTTQIDMSALMEMLGQMGAEGDEKIEADTSVGFSALLDSVQELTPEEKTLLKDATAHIQASSTSNKLVIAISAPFTKIEEIDRIKSAIGKVDAVSKAMDK